MKEKIEINLNSKEDLDRLSDVLTLMNLDLGVQIADMSEHGCIVAGGRRKRGGDRRFTVVIATNDAADTLDQWLNEQVEVRSKACTDAGLRVSSSVHGLNKPFGGAT